MTLRSIADPDAGQDAPPVECGALAVALAHAVAAADSGVSVLVIDADATGSRLAQRVGDAAGVDAPPAQRGLSTLIAVGGGFDPGSVERHCWELPRRNADAARVLLAAAPSHPRGAAHAVEWLAERAEQIAALHGAMTVLVSLPGPLAAAHRELLAAAARQLVASPVAAAEPANRPQATLTAARARSASARPCELRCGGAVLARMGPVRTAVLLGRRARRRERVALDALTDAARQLAAERGLSTSGDPAPGSDLSEPEAAR